MLLLHNLCILFLRTEISDPSTFSSNLVPLLNQHVPTGPTSPVDGTHSREKINAGNKKNWTRTRASESQRSPILIINIESIRRLKNVNAHHPYPWFFSRFPLFPLVFHSSQLSSKRDEAENSSNFPLDSAEPRLDETFLVSFRLKGYAFFSDSRRFFCSFVD